MYKLLIKPLLFLLKAESAHHFSFNMLMAMFSVPGVSSLAKKIYSVRSKKLEREVFGIKFPNPVGLAAGFDKDAKAIDQLANFGFGFIEIGTITPKGQPGNDKPRLFRLVEDDAVINRMGFNNQGVNVAIERLKSRKSDVIVGGNIGKNKATPNDRAFEDYKICFEQLFDYVDYFVVNVSSPNTPGLRELQEKEPLQKLLISLKELNEQKENPKPILLKIAPDLTTDQLDDIVEIVSNVNLDGVIATNTTVDRGNLKTHWERIEQIGAGGLSGKPLTKKSTEVIKYLADKSNGSFPIVGVGGIMTAQDAIEKLNAGASLVQIYSGFIYDGPNLIKSINKELLKVDA